MCASSGPPDQNASTVNKPPTGGCRLFAGHNGVLARTSASFGCDLDNPSTRAIIPPGNRPMTGCVSSHPWGGNTLHRHPFGLLLLAPVLFSAACPSDGSKGPSGTAYHCSGCAQVPEALAASDSLPSGRYKGVIVGDGVTGNIEVYIPADQTAESPIASLTVNGQESYINNGTQPTLEPVFYSAPVTLRMSLSATGEVTSATLTFKDGRQAIAIVQKELSTKLVEAFEGTWTTPAQMDGTVLTGNWNYVLQDGIVHGGYDGDDNGTVTGSEALTILTLTAPGGAGTRNDDGVSGTGTVAGTAITWTGKRTL